MRNRILLHILFWIVYIIQDTTLEAAWVKMSFKEATDVEVFLIALHSNLLLLPVKLAFVYFLLYQVSRESKERTNYLLLAIKISIALSLAIIGHRLINNNYIQGHVYFPPERAPIFNIRPLLGALLDIGFVAGGAVALKLFRMQLSARQREKELEKEKLQNELKYLRTQTNPHFLFNTLNNIYALARKKADNTAEAVLKLSNLLRSMLYETQNRIPVSSEVKLMEDYVELQRLRYSERLFVSFNKKFDDPSQPIASLLLLPFIENAFKHGVSETRFESVIHIDIRLQDRILNFRVENTTDPAGGNVTGNIGLQNSRRQLQLLYPEHNLTVSSGEIFIIELMIKLDNYAGL